jgi:hypothetical protein
MIHTLKVVTVLTLATAIATPAFAKAPHARRDGTAAVVAAIAAAVAAAAAADGPLLYQSPYRWQNNNLNPDFQLGGDR